MGLEGPVYRSRDVFHSIPADVCCVVCDGFCQPRPRHFPGLGYGDTWSGCRGRPGGGLHKTKLEFV